MAGMRKSTITTIALALLIACSALAQSVPASQPSSSSRPNAESRPFVTAAKQLEQADAWIATPPTNEAVSAFGPACELRFRMYKSPKPLRIWVAKIDLTAPGVRITATEPAKPSGADAKFETLCQNTLEFAQNRGVQLAFNASAFGPMRVHAGEPMDVVGLAVDDGCVFSQVVDNRNFGAMFISRDGRVSLKAPPLSPDEAWDVIPGFRMLVDDGRLAVSDQEANTDFGNVNPRTAVAVDANGKTLWIVIVDGRQKDVSAGMTLVELAALFLNLGVHDALNLDGGGSSTMVLESKTGTFGVVNTPVGQRAPGTLRQVALNVGLYLPGAAPAPAGKPSGLRDTLVRFTSEIPMRGEYVSPTDAERAVLLEWLRDGDPDRLASLRSDRARVLSMLAEALRWRSGESRAVVAADALAQWLRHDVESFVNEWFRISAPTSLPASAPTKSDDATASAMARGPTTGPLAQIILAGAGEPIAPRQLAARGDLVQWSSDGTHVGVYWGRDFDEHGRERVWVWSAGEKLHGLPISGRQNAVSGAGPTWLIVGADVQSESIWIVRPHDR